MFVAIADANVHGAVRGVLNRETTPMNSDGTPRDDTAPGGHIRSHSDCEQAVFNELFLHGRGTAAQLAARLAAGGEVFSEPEVRAALDGWVARGWVEVTAGRAHLSAAAIAYMR